ncbi:MAG TPA: hypothetical protein DEB39_17140 [Planctomycetaceae bacterium]|nr:hypothetical protein [Planctomycetaceae bacterium]
MQSPGLHHETNDGVGRTRYHLTVAKNNATASTDAMTAFSIWTGKPVGTQANLNSSYYFSTESPGSLTVSNASNWPTRGFWIRNRTVNGGNGDLRYVDYRSGNTLYVKPVTWGYVQFKSGSLELKSGMAIIGSTYGTTAIIDQVVVTSGSWAAGNATGTLILKKIVGSTFYNNDSIKVDDTQHALVAATSTRGYRGFTATNWYANDKIEPTADIDIGINLPESGLFKNPATENIAPDGVIFSHHTAQEEALILESLLAENSVGIWIRQTILDGTQARQDIDGSLSTSWY